MKDFFYVISGVLAVAFIIIGVCYLSQAGCYTPGKEIFDRTNPLWCVYQSK